jgi:TfoX/Sxy family transcriptional regulator of competence genes
VNERQNGHRLLAMLQSEFAADDNVTSGRMFSGQGLATHGKIFAFVSNTGRLVVKVPHSEVVDRIAKGAEGVTMGERTMREWVSIAPPDDDDIAGWHECESRRR